MMASRETHHEVHQIALDEHHTPASHVVEQHTIHFHHSSGGGWVDVPMPGMQTQYQQGSHVPMEVVAHHHHHSHSHAPVEEQQLPIFMMAMLPAEVPRQIDNPILQEMPHIPQAAIQEPVASMADIPAQSIHIDSGPAPAIIEHEVAPVAHMQSEMPRLHFKETVHEERAEQPKAENVSISEHKQEKPRPTEFHTEAPKSEEIRLAKEERVEAVAPPAEHIAQPIGLETIMITAHIGYIPSVRKRERQLKVALGAEGIPPQ
jgi:hypothetical protein